MSIDLPEWPDIGPCRPGWYVYPDIPPEHRACIHPYMVENKEAGEWYHKDAYNAVLARLRVAVEALKEIRSVHPLMHNGGNWDKFVDKALSAIGPLPPDSAEG